MHVYTPEAFLDAIVKWIIAGDQVRIYYLFGFFTDIRLWQSLNVIEDVNLRSIFLMLRPGLRNQDIPHRTKLHSHIMKAWDLHVQDLKRKMRVSHYTTYYTVFLSVI